MGGRQLSVDLSAVANRVQAKKTTQVRLNYHKGDVVFEPEHDVDVSAVPVDVNETTVIRLILPQQLAPSTKLEIRRHYAKSTAVKSQGAPLSFEVDIEDAKRLVSARLLIGIHRGGGITKPLTVDVNGTTIEVDSGDASEFTEFFAPLDVIVSPKILREKNKVNIKAETGATVTSVHLITLTKTEL